MKHCPLCATEYYDEAKWCPDCEYDFPAGAAPEPSSPEEIAPALDRIASGEDAGDTEAARVAHRLADLYAAAGEDPNSLWRLSPDFLKSHREYDLAARLHERWKKARRQA